MDKMGGAEVDYNRPKMVLCGIVPADPDLLAPNDIAYKR